MHKFAIKMCEFAHFCSKNTHFCIAHFATFLSQIYDFDRLTNSGATVIVIEHDLDILRASDYIIDMGPGGGEAGGRIVASGSAAEICACKESVTGRYL